jgi:heat shock protein HslJ
MMNKIFNKISLVALVFVTILLFQNAVFAQTKTEFIVVADYLTDCAGVSKRQCLQIKKPQDAKWQMFYSQIENFRFEPGYFYLLEVSKTEIKTPAADASRFKYRLKKIINREKSENSGGNESNGELSGIKWVLEKIEGVKVNTESAYITFDESKNTFGGKGGCNGMGGAFKVDGSRIDMFDIISTKMFCQDTSAIENSFLKKLDEVNRFEIKNGKLFLYRDNRLSLELTAAK